MTAPTEKTPEERLAAKLEPFPAEFQQLIREFRAERTPAGLARIVIGMLEYHGGDTFRSKHAVKGDEVLLIEDLGFDSLALVELSFQAEDFIGVVIQLEDFPKIRTLADLQSFLREKCFPAAAAG